MTDVILSMLSQFAYLSWTAFQVIVMARKREVVFVILYILPVLCVESARDIAAGIGMQSSLGAGFNYAVFVVSVLMLNAYLVTILGWLEFSEIGKEAVRSRKLALTMICALILSYIYVFEGIGLRDTLTSAETHRFTDALYFIIATFTTVGYGDVIPKDHVGRALAALASLDAYLVLAIAVSTMLPRFLKQQGLRFESDKPGAGKDLP